MLIWKLFYYCILLKAKLETSVFLRINWKKITIKDETEKSTSIALY